MVTNSKFRSATNIFTICTLSIGNKTVLLQGCSGSNIWLMSYSLKCIDQEMQDKSLTLYLSEQGRSDCHSSLQCCRIWCSGSWRESHGAPPRYRSQPDDEAGRCFGWWRWRASPGARASSPAPPRPCELEIQGEMGGTHSRGKASVGKRKQKKGKRSHLLGEGRTFFFPKVVVR